MPGFWGDSRRAQGGAGLWTVLRDLCLEALYASASSRWNTHGEPSEAILPTEYPSVYIKKYICCFTGLAGRVLADVLPDSVA